jgi:hypothetical protein
MRNTMMFMSVAAVAACFAYRPVVAAEVQSATAVAAVAPAAAQPAATNVVHKRALKPIAKRLVAHIDLSSQTMSVEVDGQSQYSWKISSGAANGYQTPTGVYTPTHTTLLHRSRKYDNAPMPHAVFFRSGFAVHATGATWALGRPASHGCVRLAPGNARTFYSLVNEYGKSATQIRIAGVTPVKTSLHAQPASSSRRNRGFSEPSFSWTPFTIGTRTASYSEGSRMRTTRRGNKIIHTWW